MKNIIFIVIVVIVSIFFLSGCANQFVNPMGDPLDFGNLGLKYSVQLKGLDGESFLYGVYFNDTPGDEQVEQVKAALDAYEFQLVGDDYAGYMDVSLSNNRVLLYVDLGGVAPQNENSVIYGVLYALNEVEGIKKVLINE